MPRERRQRLDHTWNLRLQSSAANCKIDIEYNYIRDLYNTFLGFFGV